VQPLVEIECDGDFVQSPNATDACDGPLTTTLTRDDVESGGCPANRTIHRQWTATDVCGNPITQEQTIEIADRIPPFSCPTDLICFRLIQQDSRLIVEHLSEPGAFFCAGDLCSAINITVTGCSSNQFEEVGDVHEGEFTSHCRYDAETDTLSIRPVLNPLNCAGRIFTVTGVVTDACGHSAPLTRDIWIPLNQNSTECVDFELPEDFLVEHECAPIPFNCPGVCPCEFEDNLCSAPDAGAVGQITLALTSSEFSASDDSTTFSYQVDSDGGLVDELLLGIDLTDFELLSVSFDNVKRIGFIPNSYVGGLVFDLRNGIPDSIDLVFRGNVASVAGNTPYQAWLEGPNVCDGEKLVGGPASVQYSGDGQTVTGRVLITGTLTSLDQGTDNTAQIPVNGP